MTHSHKHPHRRRPENNDDVHVRFELFEANFHLLDTRYATADNSGTYSNGTANTYLSSGTYRGKVWVVAYGSPHQSNWVSLNIIS